MKHHSPSALAMLLLQEVFTRHRMQSRTGTLCSLRNLFLETMVGTSTKPSELWLTEGSWFQLALVTKTELATAAFFNQTRSGPLRKGPDWVSRLGVPNGTDRSSRCGIAVSSEPSSEFLPQRRWTPVLWQIQRKRLCDRLHLVVLMAALGYSLPSG